MKTLKMSLDDAAFGKLQGRLALLPNVMLVEESAGSNVYAKHCMTCEKPIFDNGCDTCAAESSTTSAPGTPQQ